jgi:hypothetical protein
MPASSRVYIAAGRFGQIAARRVRSPNVRARRPSELRRRSIKHPPSSPVGVLHRAPSGEQHATLERGLDALGTWEWLPAASEPAEA